MIESGQIIWEHIGGRCGKTNLGLRYVSGSLPSTWKVFFTWGGIWKPRGRGFDRHVFEIDICVGSLVILVTKTIHQNPVG